MKDARGHRSPAVDTIRDHAVRERLQGPEEEASGAGGGSGSATAAVLTFLIADVRGYTRFTQDNGDEEAGRLAALFAQLAREAILGDYQSHPLLGTPFDQLWVK